MGGNRKKDTHVNDNYSIFTILLYEKYILLPTASFDVIDNSSKLCRVKGSSTNKASINFWHGHQSVNTLRCNRSTILDACSLRNFVVIKGGKPLSDILVDFVFITINGDKFIVR